MNKYHFQHEHGVDADARRALHEIQSLVQDYRKRRDTSLKQTLRCPIQGPERDLPKIKQVPFMRVCIDCLRILVGWAGISSAFTSIGVPLQDSL